MKYTAKKMAEKLDISRSYLYYLREHSLGYTTQSDIDDDFEWNDDILFQLQKYIKRNQKSSQEENIKPVLPYKTITINNRRFLGNKYKLLPFITKVVQDECGDIHTFADIFAGTGSVASAFTDKKLITNDILYSNYIANFAWFGAENYSKEKIIAIIQEYNSLSVDEDNYMSKNFADTYFSLEDCRKIGFIRQNIEDRYTLKEINERERALLITSLIYAMDKIANTCGHYDAYRRNGSFDKHLVLAVPLAENNLNSDNICCNTDSNVLVQSIEADLVYIDPPYNSRQYCDAYHLLENVARWDKPEVFGVAKKMDRTSLKSDYCTQKAAAAFADLIENIHAKYIMLSYNNMAEKGNERSNAKITDEDIISILEKRGTVKIFSEDYKAFSTGKSYIKGNQERLFLCICHEPPEKEWKIIPSAMNYTGGKFKLLPQLLPLFPKDIDMAVDLFCGGSNVGINLNCPKVYFNDSNRHLMKLLETFRNLPEKEIFQWLFDHIKDYGLSMVCDQGYDFYHCNSSAGLAKYNKKGFNCLRDDFNARTIQDNEYFLMLYLLMVYSFNNQIRFNQKGEFNLPVGKRDFNKRMQQKLRDFLTRIKSCNYQFSCKDFRKFDTAKFTNKSFFYADPPYLIGCATYNEQDGWTEQDEKDLLAYLVQLDKKGIRFALSNVIENKGKRNALLTAWLDTHKNFQAIPLKYSYANANYHGKKDGITKEILVVNYQL